VRGDRLSVFQTLRTAWRVLRVRPFIFLGALLLFVPSLPFIAFGIAALWIGVLEIRLTLDRVPELAWLVAPLLAASVVLVPTILTTLLTVPFHFVWHRLTLRTLAVVAAAGNPLLLCARFVGQFICFGILASGVAAPALVLFLSVDMSLPVTLTVAAVTACLALYLVARLSLVLPAAAIGQSFGWRGAWRGTRANGVAIAVLIGLAMLPLAAIDAALVLPTVACDAGFGCAVVGWLYYALALGGALSLFALHLIAYFLSSAILSGVLAASYKSLVLDRAATAMAAPTS